MRWGCVIAGLRVGPSEDAKKPVLERTLQVGTAPGQRQGPGRGGIGKGQKGQTRPGEGVEHDTEETWRVSDRE